MATSGLICAPRARDQRRLGALTFGAFEVPTSRTSIGYETAHAPGGALIGCCKLPTLLALGGRAPDDFV